MAKNAEINIEQSQEETFEALSTFSLVQDMVNCPGGLMYFCFRNKSLCHSQYLTPISRTVAREVCETGYFVAQDTYIKYHRSHGSAQTHSGVLTVRTNRHLEKVKTRWIFRIYIKRFDCLINVRKFKNVNITLLIPSLLCCKSLLQSVHCFKLDHITYYSRISVNFFSQTKNVFIIIFVIETIHKEINLNFL